MIESERVEKQQERGNARNRLQRLTKLSTPLMPVIRVRQLGPLPPSRLGKLNHLALFPNGRGLLWATSAPLHYGIYRANVLPRDDLLSM